MNDQYSALYASYKWYVPSQFNISEVCVHRWATNPLEGRRPAILGEDEFGDALRCSYGQLADTTCKLANGLLRMGVAQGDRVVVAMAQGPEFVAACMAILGVGAIVVPLSSILTAQQVTARVVNAQAKIAIVDSANIPSLLQAQSRYPALGQIIGFGFQHEATLSWSSLLARQNNSFRPAPTSAQSPAFLVYPMATDAPLQGIVLSHSTLIGQLPGFVASQNWFPQPEDIFWTQSDWTTPDGLLNGLLPCLYFGRPIVGLQGNHSVQRTLNALINNKVTNISVPWSALRAVMVESPDLNPGQFSLRAIMATGTHPTPTIHEWCEAILGLSPNHVYGVTEAAYLIGHSHLRWPARPGSMGRAYPGHLVSVLDEAGRVCPAGAVGEIAVNRFDLNGFRDPAIFLGYWQQDDETAKRFRHNWFLTGDLASIDRDGYFWFAGHKQHSLAATSPTHENQTGPVSLSL